MILLIFLLLALGSLATAGIFVRRYAALPNSSKKLLRPLEYIIIGVFFAVLFMFLPIYYTAYFAGSGDPLAFFRPFLLALHNTLRVFILDGEFDMVRDVIVSGDTLFPALGVIHAPIWLGLIYETFFAILYLAAPALTLGFILSVFRNLIAEFRLRIGRNRDCYIFSELNERAITLAESIRSGKGISGPEGETAEQRQQRRSRLRRAFIIFTDVFEQNEEENYELRARAGDIGAICIKKDASEIEIGKKMGKVEFFLIGLDESENLNQALHIIEKHRARPNTKVFVFTDTAGSECVLDSVDKGELHGPKDEEAFRVRRVNPLRTLAQSTVRDANLFDHYVEEDGKKIISVLLVGMGEQGIELFKTLSWFCQMEGYLLELNVIDRRSGDSDIRSVLRHQCPELIDMNNCEVEGESHYSIEFFPGIDVYTDSFDNLFLDTDRSREAVLRRRRLARSTVAFVALGDDDRNIETAIHLRMLFDRVKAFNAKNKPTKEEEPLSIYSIVYNPQKVRNLVFSMEGDEPRLVNYKGIPYNIRFIGSLESQFVYDNIYRKRLELGAVGYHTSWVKLYYDQFSSEYEINMEREEKNYQQFEFFRNASIAKFLYQSTVRARFPDTLMCVHIEKPTEIPASDCQCDRCVRRRPIEHQRWNAYMRSIGYVYGPVRMDRAKVHNCLIPFDDLPEAEKIKD